MREYYTWKPLFPSFCVCDYLCILVHSKIYMSKEIIHYSHKNSWHRGFILHVRYNIHTISKPCPGSMSCRVLDISSFLISRIVHGNTYSRSFWSFDLEKLISHFIFPCRSWVLVQREPCYGDNTQD